MSKTEARLEREANREQLEPLLYDIPSAAKLMGVSVRSVNRLLATHELSPVKIRSRTLIATSDIEDYITKSKKV
jgi:excisionase family DNA binding protein